MLLNAVLSLSRCSIKILLAILLFLLMHFPSVALATPVCDDTNIGSKIIVLPGASISPGVDQSSLAPVYSGTFGGLFSNNYFNCHVTSGDHNQYEFYVFLEPLSSYGSSYYFNIGMLDYYNVVALNAPAFGVGLSTQYASPPGMAVNTINKVEFSEIGQIQPMLTGRYMISLVNGSLLQPGVLAGSDLPSFGIYGIIYKSDGTPYDGKKIVMGSVSFSGSVNIIPFTCQTPDVAVPMGNYKTTDFTGVGSTSPWVDFNIELDNCPGSYPGYYTYKNQMNVLINPVYGNPTP